MHAATASLLAASVLLAVSGSVSARQEAKSVIKYLDTDYLLRDGCPEPVCDQEDPECVRSINMIRALYSHCTQSQEGQDVGCLRDRVGRGGGAIVLPVYASVCSAMCYEPNPEDLKKIVPCPHPGFRQHNPGLQLLF